MLRRLEKGLNTAKLKQANETSMSSVFPAVDSQSSQVETHFGTMIRPLDEYSASGNGLSSFLPTYIKILCITALSLWKSTLGW